MERLDKILEAAKNKIEKDVMKVFQNHHGVAYRACFADALLNWGWQPLIRGKRNNLGLIKSPRGKIIDPFDGYREEIGYAVAKINQPNFYFVLDWGIVPFQRQINELRKVIREFTQQKKEICVLGLKRLAAWFVLLGGVGEVSFRAKQNSVDKKYFKAIYNGYPVEIDIDIHSHLIDLNTSSDDRNSAVGENSRRFFVATYQEGLTPYTSRGRIHTWRGKKVVIPWHKIRKEFLKIRKV